jgi:hypothetical protein
MREYDEENIRLYTPVLQRVIILVAVIIAVPVVMWTITAVIRTYVAPPKVPTFQQMTENQPADTGTAAPQTLPAPTPAAGQAQTSTQAPTPAAPQAATPAPAPPSKVADAGTMASDAHPVLLEVKKPADSQTATAANSPAAAAAATVSAAPAQPMAPMAAPAAPAAPAAAAAAPAMAVTQNSAAKPDGAAAGGTANNFAWPNPNTHSPPSVGTDNAATDAAPAPAAPQAPAASDDASAELPPGPPIAGRVPLPPRRPMVLAMAVSTPGAMAALMPGAIPLPRPRPTDAPAAAPSSPADASSSTYDPGLEPGHY